MTAELSVNNPPTSMTWRVHIWMPPRPHAVKASVAPPEIANSHSLARIRGRIRPSIIGDCCLMIDLGDP